MQKWEQNSVGETDRERERERERGKGRKRERERTREPIKIICVLFFASP